MKIHVLTLNWNGGERLVKMAENLSANLAWITSENGRCKPGWEHSQWYVRDNGSTDGSIDAFDGWGFHSDYRGSIAPEILEAGHNRDSFSKGMNSLFEMANPNDDDLILLLNNDIVFNDQKSLLKMYSLMKKTNAGVVGCRLMYNNKPNSIQHAGVIFSGRYGFMPFHYRPNEKVDDDAKKNRYFQAVTAACCFVKASSWKRVGGLSNKLNWAFEDIDLCLRIGEKEKIAYCGGTEILHEESATLKKNPVQKLFMNSNVAYFKEKWWKDGKPKYEIDHDKYLKNPNYNII